METYEQKLHINDDAFEKMRNDADIVLQRLIKNMVEKDSMEGKVTITIDVALVQEFIPNTDPKIEGETRRILKPKFAHKVGSVMQIKSEEKGSKNYDGMELVWDDEQREYILKPIVNTDQMTIFDVEYREVNEPEADTDEPEALEGKRILALPGDVGDTDEEIINNEPESEAEGYIEAEVVSEEDISDEFDVDGKIPFNPDDDYDYEEPDNDY